MDRNPDKKEVFLNLETLQHHYDIGISRPATKEEDDIAAPRNAQSLSKSETRRKKSGSFVKRLFRKISMKKEKRGISKNSII